MSLDPTQQAVMTAAVTPSPADVMTAKQVALELLGGGQYIDHERVLSLLCQRAGIARHGERYEMVAVGGLRRGEDRDFDPLAAPIVRTRLDLATSEAFGDLVAQGLMVPIHGESDDYVTIPIGDGGTSNSTRITMQAPKLPGRFRSPHALVGRSEFRFFDRSKYLDGIDDLLGPRGGRCATEALDAFRRGLFLSAANMLGAASEAAWYTIGEALVDEVPDLEAQLNKDGTAQVIRLVANALEVLKGQRTTVTELRAHAAYLRDLRNYGIHPRGASDDDQEGAFTETGCALLIMETRRYLSRLRDVAVLRGALPQT